MMLSGPAAAAAFGLINSTGQLGGLAGPFLIGFFNQRTHSLTTSFACVALAYVAASALVLTLKIRNPLDASPLANQPEN
jgi:ACS family tartrate transporter-like MFS transporter